MTTLLVPFLATTPIGGLLMTFLIAILLIAMIGGLIWAVNTYVHPIPPPILMILSIVLIIVIVLVMLGEIPLPFMK